MSGNATRDYGVAPSGYRLPDATRLGRVTLQVSGLERSLAYYESVLGFVNGPRPPFTFPGAWLYSGDHPVLHLNDISPTDREQRPDSGVIDHVAFGSRGFEVIGIELVEKSTSKPGAPAHIELTPMKPCSEISVGSPRGAHSAGGSAFVT